MTRTRHLLSNWLHALCPGKDCEESPVLVWSKAELLRAGAERKPGTGRLMKVLLCLMAVPWSLTPATASTLYVPSQYSTLQSAIDAAVAGDVVQLADGIYSGPGFRSIRFQGKAITVRSEHGAAYCVVDIADYPNGFSFDSGETPASVLEGLTITGAHREQPGAGLRIDHASPTVRNCVIIGNTTGYFLGTHGGGVDCRTGSPRMVGCTISGNIAYDDIGELNGGGICAGTSSSVVLEHCLVYGNCNGEILADASSTVTLSCCLIAPEDGLVGDGTFVDAGGNIYGDPLFCVAGMCQEGHISGDPLDYRVDEASPCLPQNNSCGQLIGALHVGCPTTGVAQSNQSAGKTKPLRLAGPAPNPTFDRLSFSLILDRPRPVDIRVVNVAGQVVRVLSNGSLGAGEHSLMFNLTSSGEPPLAGGMYNLVVSAGRQRDIRRFVVLR
jgi:hypothetical protein